MIFQAIKNRYPWTVHRVLGHYLAGVFRYLGLGKFANIVHDWSFPEHKNHLWDLN